MKDPPSPYGFLAKIHLGGIVHLFTKYIGCVRNIREGLAVCMIENGLSQVGHTGAEAFPWALAAAGALAEAWVTFGI